LLFNKINYNKPNIIDLINRAKRHQIELNEARLNQGRVKTKTELARKLEVSKARLTQIMNLLKLAPEIQEYLKNLSNPSLLRFFNEKRLRPIASIKDKQAQLEKFQELKREVGIEFRLVIYSRFTQFSGSAGCVYLIYNLR
jgi:DNA-directed RNA polymerase sigma subunit (sigma70/sigma32)